PQKKKTRGGFRPKLNFLKKHSGLVFYPIVRGGALMFFVFFGLIVFDLGGFWRGGVGIPRHSCAGLTPPNPTPHRAKKMST
ncbi:hypothetical protein ACVGW2_13770, partial [Enterobacter intestinihominis]